MAAPSYTTDLTDIDLCESGSSYEEFSGYTKGDGADVETDLYIQGSACASDENNNKTGVGHSIGVDYGSNITFDTGDCFFAWMFYQVPNAVDTFANGGYRLLVGGDTNNFNGWKVGGSDFGRNPYGGWVNVAVDPTFTADYTVGTPSGNYRHFATAFNCVSGTLKGRPVCADAYRYGRGEIKIEHGDSSNGYGTFSGIAAQNDSQSNRWGLFQAEGTGYLWKGLLSFGNSTNSCDFRDSDVNITIDNTPRTYTAFNKIEINNTSSRVDWTGISIIALSASQLSPGNFEVVDNADVNFDSCTFTDMNTFVFMSNSTILKTTFRRCAQVTQGGATFTNCLFTKSDASISLSVDDISVVTGCTFESDGSNHAVDLGTISSNTSIDWKNYLTDYASSDGSTGNEAIKVNVASGVTLTVNVGSGYDTPSFYNTGSGSITVVVNPVDTIITVKDLEADSVLPGARVLLWVTDNSNYFYQASVTITGSGTTATVSHTGHGLSTGDSVIINGANEDVYNGAYSVTVTDANTYTYTTSETISTSPATGTITSTMAILNDTTDANGQIKDTRSWNNDQPVSGRVRKSSASPYYIQGVISGTISKTSGFSTTIQLIKDE